MPPGLGCQYANNAASCDDGDACTSDDLCSGGACASGAALDCDDENPCTADSCDRIAGCGHEVIAGCQLALMPSGSPWGHALLVAFVLAAGSLALAARRDDFA